MAETRTAARMARLVAQWRKSGESGASFARRHQLYSVVQSCKLIDVPPFAYLKDVLRRLPTHSHRLIDHLTPSGWVKTFGPVAV
jgi:hypothetical protein